MKNLICLSFVLFTIFSLNAQSSLLKGVYEVSFTQGDYDYSFWEFSGENLKIFEYYQTKRVNGKSVKLYKEILNVKYTNNFGLLSIPLHKYTGNIWPSKTVKLDWWQDKFGRHYYDPTNTDQFGTVILTNIQKEYNQKWKTYIDSSTGKNYYYYDPQTIGG